MHGMELELKLHLFDLLWICFWFVDCCCGFCTTFSLFCIVGLWSCRFDV